MTLTSLFEIEKLSGVVVGQRIRFQEEKQAYTIQARSERYLVCTKPFNPRKTVLYTIVDLENGIRGTENIWGSGFMDVKSCEEAIDRLEGRGTFHSQVSNRNWIHLRVDEVLPARKTK